MVDIFNDTKERVMPGWFKFTSPGDSIQGTYVGKIVGMKSPAYNQEQIVYQLLGTDGKVTNVGFGLNKKFLHQDMEQVNFGQIIGFKFKGTIAVKNRVSGMMVNVKDYALHQDPKIVDEKWLAENKDSMPTVTKVSGDVAQAAEEAADAEYEAAGEQVVNDVPFSTPGSLTNEDKLKAIEKLAKEKLGATTPATVKSLVMEKTGLAYIPVQYDKILEALTIL